MKGARDPAMGPQIVFFTGGTALRGVSRALIELTWRSVHLVTPFDSGGSSAALRKAFGVIAVGDLRNRLLALADPNQSGFVALASLLNRRLPEQADPQSLREVLRTIADGQSAELRWLSDSAAEAVRGDMRQFLAACPQELNLEKASVGNLLLIGAWLRLNRDLYAALEQWSDLLGARGHVWPIATTDAHLHFTLDDGSVVVGQHRVSGKEGDAPNSPIREMKIIRNLEDWTPTQASIAEPIAKLIREADLICFPMGSFYTSVLANLLPDGVVDAIAEARCPKVFVANTGQDPEQRGLSVGAAAERLVNFALERSSSHAASDFLDTIVIDSEGGHYPDGIDRPRLDATGIRVLDLPLVTERAAPNYDSGRIASLLVGLASSKPKKLSR